MFVIFSRRAAHPALTGVEAPRMLAMIDAPATSAEMGAPGLLGVFHDGGSPD